MQNCEPVFAKVLPAQERGRFTTLKFRQTCLWGVPWEFRKRGVCARGASDVLWKVLLEKFDFFLFVCCCFFVLFFHWPCVKAEQPSKQLQVRERKGGMWMSLLLLKTSFIEWKVSKRHWIIKAPLTPWQSSQQVTALPGSLTPGSSCHCVTVSPCHRGLCHSPWHWDPPRAAPGMAFRLGHPKS